MCAFCLGLCLAAGATSAAAASAGTSNPLSQVTR